MLNTGRTLEEKTQIYWDISLCWKGYPTGKKAPTTGDALKLLTDTLEELGPQRKLTMRVDHLRNNIVVGNPRQSRIAKKVPVND